MNAARSFPHRRTLLVATSVIVVSCCLQSAGSAQPKKPVNGKEPVPVVDAQLVEKLINQLGADRFADRARASKRLKLIGEPVLIRLVHAADKHTDPEVQLRASKIVAYIRRKLTGQERSWNAHTGGIIALDLTDDGKRVLTGSWDKTAALWDFESGKQVRVFKGHTRQVTEAVFFDRGKKVATCSADGTIRVWETETAKQLLLHKVKSGASYTVCISPDEKTLAYGDGTNVGLLNLKTQTLVSTFSGHTSQVAEAVFSPDGKLIATCAEDAKLRLHSVETGRFLREFTGHNGWVWTVTFSPDGANLLSGGEDGAVKIWDVKTGRETRTLKGHSGGVFQISFSPDGKRIMTSGYDKTLRLWYYTTGKSIHTYEGHTGQACDVVFTRNGRQVLSVSHDNTVRLWNAPK